MKTYYNLTVFMISNHAFVLIGKTYSLYLSHPSITASCFFIQHCLPPQAFMSSQAAASGLHHLWDCSRVVTDLLFSLNQPPLFPHISLHNSQQHLASNNNYFYWLMICLWYDTVYIDLAMSEFVAKNGVNPAKASQKLVVKPHNILQKRLFLRSHTICLVYK